MPMTRPTPQRGKRTYWILRQDQVRCLASARRQEILDRLVAVGPSSVRECATSIGLAPSAVYRHLHQLVAVGLVVEAGRRVVQRRTEKLYAPIAPRVRLAGALDQGLEPRLFKTVVASLSRQMNRDFAAAVARPGAVTRGARRNLGFFRLVGAPDARTLARINRHLAEIAELLWSTPGRKRPLVALGWVLAPVGRGAAAPASRKPAARRRS
jgi:DNA-binding transcriptional ArsR family regulator